MTFKDKSITKLYAFALAAVFALVLAGCGGGGGSATAPDPEPPAMPEPTPQEMCEGDGGEWRNGACVSAEELEAEMAEATALSDAKRDAMAAYMAAMAAVSGAKDPVAMANAQPYAAMAKDASDMAAAATTSEMAMKYRMDAEKYRDMAMKAGMTRSLGLTALANKELNTEDIRNAELEGKDPPKSVSNATNVGAAIKAAAEGADPAAAAGLTSQSGMSNSGATALVVAEIAATAVVEHKKDGSTFKVSLGGVEMLVGETPSRFQTKGGWEAQDLRLPSPTAATDMLRSHLVISTDIQAPTQNYEATATAGAITPGTSVIVAGEIAGDGSNFAATLNSNPADNMPPVEGQFRCTDPAATPCSISVDASGKIVSAPGYAFHESDGITRQDGDYLAWGFWMQGSTRSSGPTATNRDAQAGAFAYGSDQFDVKTALTGTATYNGVANGMYSAGGMVEYFDADVTLNANFGGTVGADSDADVAGNDGLLLGAVTGSVSNIMAGGMAVDGSLTLKRAPIINDNTAVANGGVDQNTADTGTFTGPFTGDAEGTVGGALLKGNWGGQFYGPNKASGKGIETEYPTTAAGTFSVSGGGHTPMSLIGSFGTWKAE